MTSHFELTRRMYRLYQIIDSDEDSDQVTALEDIVYLDECIRPSSNRHLLADRLVQLGFVELCQHACAINENKRLLLNQEPPDSQSSLRSARKTKSRPNMVRGMNILREVLSCTLNLTDISELACRRVLEIEFYKDLFGMLRDFADQAEDHNDDNESPLQKYYFGILYNTIQAVGESRQLYREEGAVSITQNFRQHSNSSVSSLALVLLTYVINEDENYLLGSDGSLFQFFSEELRDALSHERRVALQSGYRAIELLTAINKLAVNDENKEHIIESGVLGSYVQLLTDEHSTTDELYAVVQGLWTLALNRPESLCETEGCIEGLISVLENCGNFGIEREVRGALEALGQGDNYELIGSPEPVKVETVPLLRVPSCIETKPLQTGHVFISYNHGSKAVCWKLRDHLRAAGFSVWIDTDVLCQTITADIIKGLDSATVLLACLSQKYYESPFCKKEFMYAADNHKQIVPVIVELRYRPHGWLQFHLPDNLCIDFSVEENFEDSFAKLCKALIAAYQSADNSQTDTRISAAVDGLDFTKIEASGRSTNIRMPADKRRGCQIKTVSAEIDISSEIARYPKPNKSEAEFNSGSSDEPNEESEQPKRKRSRRQDLPDDLMNLYRPVKQADSAEELFGRSVGLTLAKLNPRDRALTKLNIQQVLVDAELGHLKKRQKGRRHHGRDSSTSQRPEDDEFSQPYVLTQ